MTAGTATDLVSLVHVADPTRTPDDVPGVEVLGPDASPRMVLRALDRAAVLIVDDALAFPFEAFRESQRDVPLAVRVPQPLDAAGLEAVMGADLLDHLTALDVVVGDRASWLPVQRARRLPERQWAGAADLDVDQVVSRTRERRRRFELALTTGSAPGALDLRDHEIGGGGPAGRLRLAKGRLRVEGRAVREALEGLALRQPRTRPMQVAVVAGMPELYAPALPRRVGPWTPVPLLPDPDAEEGAAALPAHLRLPLPSGTLDAVVVAGSLLHSAPHALHRLVAEAARVLRPGGGLVVVGDVVPDPTRPPDARPTPLGAAAVLDLVDRATGRQVTVLDVRAVRRPGHDLHRVGVFSWQFLGTAKGADPWT